MEKNSGLTKQVYYIYFLAFELSLGKANAVSKLILSVEMLQYRIVYSQCVHDNTTGPPAKQNENYPFFENIKCFPGSKGKLKEF